MTCAGGDADVGSPAAVDHNTTQYLRAGLDRHKRGRVCHDGDERRAREANDLPLSLARLFGRVDAVLIPGIMQRSGPPTDA